MRETLQEINFEIFVLPGCYAALIVSYRRFGKHMCPIFNGHEVHLILKNGTDRFSGRFFTYNQCSVTASKSLYLIDTVPVADINF